MKLKNILIAVNDVEQSRLFYSDLFGLDLVLDNDGNMILTDGLVLQDKSFGRNFSARISYPRAIPANYILRKPILMVSLSGWKRITRKSGM